MCVDVYGNNEYEKCMRQMRTILIYSFRRIILIQTMQEREREEENEEEREEEGSRW